MKLTVYKVVTLNTNGEYCSIFSPYPLTYKVGETTKPLEQTFLFAFLTLQGAIRMYFDCSAYMECEADVPEDMPYYWLSNKEPFEKVQRIFRAQRQTNRNLATIEEQDVILCNSITPIKILE